MQRSAEVRQLCDEIRRFIRNEVDPRSRWIEENDEVPDDLLQKARELGLFGLTIPEEYGGIGLDLAGKCAVEEEMGKTNYGFATVIGNHTGISTTGIVALGTPDQKRKYLPRMALGEWIGAFALTEPQAGSDPAALRTRAVRKGDRYVLNGEKIYITNAG
ncbi:MAG: acyl-CoA dehydrogenase family protein, partial [Burkholderiales bacterium]